MNINLNNLSAEEVNLILSGLSELPTKSNAWPIAMKIKAQADEQLAETQVTDVQPKDSNVQNTLQE